MCEGCEGGMGIDEVGEWVGRISGWESWVWLIDEDLGFGFLLLMRGVCSMRGWENN